MGTIIVNISARLDDDGELNVIDYAYSFIILGCTVFVARTVETDNDKAFAAFYLATRKCLSATNNLLNISGSIMEQAIRQRYLATENARILVHQQLLQCMEGGHVKGGVRDEGDEDASSTTTRSSSMPARSCRRRR